MAWQRTQTQFFALPVSALWEVLRDPARVPEWNLAIARLDPRTQPAVAGTELDLVPAGDVIGPIHARTAPPAVITRRRRGLQPDLAAAPARRLPAGAVVAARGFRRLRADPARLRLRARLPALCPDRGQADRRELRAELRQALHPGRRHRHAGPARGDRRRPRFPGQPRGGRPALPRAPGHHPHPHACARTAPTGSCRGTGRNQGAVGRRPVCAGPPDRGAEPCRRAGGPAADAGKHQAAAFLPGGFHPGARGGKRRAAPPAGRLPAVEHHRDLCRRRRETAHRILAAARRLPGAAPDDGRGHGRGRKPWPAPTPNA